VKNLFRDGTEKRFSYLQSTGFSPPKKKGGRPPRRGAGISPRDIDVLDADKSDDNVEDGDYSPNPANKDPRPTMQPKRRDKKVILDSSYFFYLRPLTFDADRFRRGHAQVYSMDDISRFDTNYQKQLSFSFSATRATRKKSAAMINARASCLRDIDLDVAPISFSCDTTDHHGLSRYVFEDLLSCPVGSRIVVCIRLGVEGDPTETSYSDQAKCITSCRSESGMATESWQMAGDQYLVLQGKLFRSTMHDEVMSGNLSQKPIRKVFCKPAWRLRYFV